MHASEVCLTVIFFFSCMIFLLGSMVWFGMVWSGLIWFAMVFYYPQLNIFGMFNFLQPKYLSGYDSLSDLALSLAQLQSQLVLHHCCITLLDLYKVNIGVKSSIGPQEYSKMVNSHLEQFLNTRKRLKGCNFKLCLLVITELFHAGETWWQISS